MKIQDMRDIRSKIDMTAVNKEAIKENIEGLFGSIEAEHIHPDDRDVVMNNIINVLENHPEYKKDYEPRLNGLKKKYWGEKHEENPILNSYFSTFSRVHNKHKTD